MLQYSATVKRALRLNLPIVALESTIIAHGMPYPDNIQMVKEVEAIVQSENAIPATIGIMHGQIQVGMSEEQILQLAKGTAKKCAIRDVPIAVTRQWMGATTVSSTMRIAHLAGIRVFATGGIGGVHRNYGDHFDVSADLTELSKTPVAVVCAGVKSILDIGNTLEYLETQSVPVIGYQTKCFPSFYTASSGLDAPVMCDHVDEIANMMEVSGKLGLNNGFVIGVPNPMPMDQVAIGAGIQLALAQAKADNVAGNKVTPYLLKSINKATKGKSLASNIALVKQNARIASKLAVAIHKRSFSTERTKSDVVVVGGAVLDIIAKGVRKEGNRPKTSNIGTIAQSWGGVGRNIAEGLHRLGNQVTFVSIIGNDAFGTQFTNAWHNLNMDVSGIQMSNSKSTAVYSATLSNDGDLDVAVADMSIFDDLNLQNSQPLLSNTRMVIFDGNVSKSASKLLIAQCHHYKIPIWFEPTSVDKSTRPLQTLHHLHYLSPNLDELYAISNHLFPHRDDATILHFQTIEKHTRIVLQAMLRSPATLKLVVVTLGSKGIYYATGTSCSSISTNYLPTTIVPIVNCTGAGDSFVSGAVTGILQNQTIEKSLKMGLQAATKSVSSNFAVHPNLSIQDLSF